MTRRPRTKVRIAGGAAAIVVVISMLAASAADARLPGASNWSYDIPTGTFISQSEFAHGASFNALVAFPGDGTGFIYSFGITIYRSTCKKDGRSYSSTLIGGYRAGGPDGPGHLEIPIRSDGRFSGRANVIDDKGVATIKGQISAGGKRMTGTVTLRTHNDVWGDCKGSGKILHAKGVRVA
jgi:hypothetical protein